MGVFFNDGLKLKFLSGENAEPKEKESDFIVNYFSTAQRMHDSAAWKRSGAGAQFRGEVQEYNPKQEEKSAYINSLAHLQNSTVAYSFTLNEVSGLYKKDFELSKGSEAHVIHSNEREVLGLDYNEQTNTVAAAMKDNAITGNLALIDLNTNDYKSITGGDCKDENPCWSMKRPDILYFNSSGAGRDYHGNFVAYGNSVINEINTATLNVKELKSDDKFSYVCPKDDAAGNLYYIKRPPKNKKKRNLFIDILLIPFRIIQALYNFLESFVTMFTGKTFTEKNANPAKGRKMNAREIMIDGNLIEADREFKRNQRDKDKLGGIIPSSWELVMLKDGMETVLRKGVASFDIDASGTIVCANGKHILQYKDGKWTKLCSGSLVLKVAATDKVHPAASADNIFG